MGYKNSNKSKIVFSILVFTTLIFGMSRFAHAYTITTTNSISITATVGSATPINPSGGGGGGGGGGGSPVASVGDSVIFKGIAYPGSTINLTQGGVLAASVPAAPDASFEISLKGLPTGTFNFGIQAIDSSGRKSLLLTYSIYISSGVTTTVNGFFLPPTLSIDKSQVKRGDTLTVVGQSLPQATVAVVFNSGTNLVKKTIADQLGLFVYKLNTLELALGDHEVKAQATSPTDTTPFSQSLGFKVGDTNIDATAKTNSCSRYDLNCDGKINLVDFSILAYWFHRNNPPKTVDFNADGKVNLTDFSILAYYWTG